MDPNDTRQVEELIHADNRTAAIDRLLEIAADAPLDDDLHDLLGRAVEDHRFRTQGLSLWFRIGYRSIEPFTIGGYRDRPWLLFYALPELGDLGPAPDFRPHRGTQTRMGDKEFFTVPDRIRGWMPIHPPTRGTYDWYEPRVRERDGFLTIEQVSVYNGRERSTDDTRLCVYRVKGSLFRARWVRFFEG